MIQGIIVPDLMPDSQRYFNVHHTTTDSLDKVKPRELHVALAAPSP